MKIQHPWKHLPSSGPDTHYLHTMEYFEVTLYNECWYFHLQHWPPCETWNTWWLQTITPLSARRIFCHLQHFSFSGTNFTFLPWKKWTNKLQASWQTPHKHILVLTFWGVSNMWSQVTQFLRPSAKSHGSTYFKRKNTWKTWWNHVSTMKVSILWLPFERLQVGGERR